jgi:hypothetical protein
VAGPRHKRRVQAAPPGVAGSPAVLPSRPCCLGLWVGTGEALCKSPPCGSLHRGSSGGAPSRRLYSQLLLARQITLLQASLVPKQALLCL